MFIQNLLRIALRDSWRIGVLAVLALGAYGPFLSLPLISDDYIQIQLGRDYGPPSEWGRLLDDALYRCRATSILFTYWTDQLLGIDGRTLNLTSFVLHLLNACLVFALGAWKRVGYRLSFFAACFFAVYQRPQEAVVWYAALPELLVFTFVVLSLWCWIRYEQSEGNRWYLAAFVAFLLALASKESGVIFVPLAAGVTLLERPFSWRNLVPIAPLAAVAAAYYFAAQAASATHLHFNDGTFSLAAPFPLTILRSMGRMFWIWGFLASAWLLWSSRGKYAPWIAASVAWIAIALLPYSFLTYQGAVPSRHTYLASVGIAILIAHAFDALRQRLPGRSGRLALIAGACVMYQVAYLWLYKFPQYVERAEPTEILIEAVRQKHHEGPVQLDCFPYGREVAQRTLEIMTHGKAWLVDANAAGNAGEVLRVNGCPQTMARN